MSATLVISFDFELGWGVLDATTWRVREQDGLYLRMRPVLAELFDFLQQHEVPSTWATVSSMTIESEADLALDHLPLAYRDAVLRFFREAATETRSGLDLLESWQRQLAPFSELCSHTATHFFAGFPGARSEQYVQDVAISLERLESLYGQRIKSLIFTRDQADFYDGVTALRPMNLRFGPNSYGKGSMGKLSRILRGGARFWQAVPQSRVIRGSHKECIQTGSLYFNWSGGEFEKVKRFQVRVQSARMLRQMQRNGGTYHVWLHPFNLAETPYHWRAFRHFLESAVRLRDTGRLTILTMQECSRTC